MMTQQFPKILALVLAITLGTACSNKKNTPQEEQNIDHSTAQNSLDWAGTYAGNLPCANCDSNEVELTLKSDETYVLIDNLIKNGEKVSTGYQGKFVWEGNNIRLMDVDTTARPFRFKVEENQVRQLDMQGNPITGNMESLYILDKLGNEIVEDKKWQIVEINGQNIESAPETHYLLFHSNDRRLEVRANCNSISMNYQIKKQFKLSVNQGISTLMACPENTEADLLKALEMADNITFDEENLSINKGRMAPLVRLKLVQE